MVDVNNNPANPVIGERSFGADPLAPIDTRPGWDQQSETEPVPHTASPPPVWRVKPGYE